MYYELPIVDETGKHFIYSINSECNNLINNIEAQYQELSLITDLPDNLNKEIYYSCQIERANIDYNRALEIMNGLLPIYKGDYMVRSNQRAYMYMMQNPVIQNTIHLRNLWEHVTEDVCDNDEIKGEIYRTGYVMVGPHMAPDYESVDYLMKNYFFPFYNKGNDGINHFVKVAMIHFYFAYIHPFCDGNGRTTRLLSMLYLINNGYDLFLRLNPSEYIYQHLQEYYRALAQSETEEMDITPFIEFYLKCIDTTLTGILKGR